jgi:hypothetical protein
MLGCFAIHPLKFVGFGLGVLSPEIPTRLCPRLQILNGRIKLPDVQIGKTQGPRAIQRVEIGCQPLRLQGLRITVLHKKYVRGPCEAPAFCPYMNG